MSPSYRMNWSWRSFLGFWWDPCCKSRKTLISDPQFAKDHLHLRASIADPNMTHLLLVSPKYSDPSKILSFSVQSLFQNPSTPAEGRCFRLRRSCQILGSCNGLLCLFNVHTRYVKLWNPFTRLTSFQRLSIWLYSWCVFYLPWFLLRSRAWQVLVAISCDRFVWNCGQSIYLWWRRIFREKASEFPMSTHCETGEIC